jgi:heme exporter protein D
MDGLSEYFAMGGYARFVWPSYAIVFAAIVLNIVWARSKLKRARLEAQRRLAMKAPPVEGGRPIEGHSS